MAPKTRGERIEVPEESVQAMRTDVKALCDREAGNTKRIDDLDKGIQAIMGKLDSLFKAGSDNSTQTGGSFQGSGSGGGPESQPKRSVNSSLFVNSDTGGTGKPPTPRFSPADWRLRRVELPMFNGIDPDGWVFRAERYFALQRFE